MSTTATHAAADKAEWEVNYLEDLQNARPQLWEIWVWREQHQILQQCLCDHVDRDAQALVNTCSTCHQSKDAVNEMT